MTSPASPLLPWSSSPSALYAFSLHRRIGSANAGAPADQRAGRDAGWFRLGMVDSATVSNAEGSGIAFCKRDPQQFRALLISQDLTVEIAGHDVINHAGAAALRLFPTGPAWRPACHGRWSALVSFLFMTGGRVLTVVSRSCGEFEDLEGAVHVSACGAGFGDVASAGESDRSDGENAHGGHDPGP